jgi:hypothetical protein
MTNASASKDKASAGDPIPPKCSVIEVHVGELKQLFNAIDPSPFRDKDLDPKAEEFIVGWAKELPSLTPKLTNQNLPTQPLVLHICWQALHSGAIPIRMTRRVCLSK